MNIRELKLELKKVREKLIAFHEGRLELTHMEVTNLIMLDYSLIVSILYKYENTEVDIKKIA